MPGRDSDACGEPSNDDGNNEMLGDPHGEYPGPHIGRALLSFSNCLLTMA